jgi:hypothetical protein
MEESFQSGSEPQNRRMDRQKFGGNRFEIRHRTQMIQFQLKYQLLHFNCDFSLGLENMDIKKNF